MLRYYCLLLANRQKRSESKEFDIQNSNELKNIPLRWIIELQKNKNFK